MIPDPLRINYRNRPAQADTQTIGLRAINQRLRAYEIQFLESSLQEFPRFQTDLLRRAFRLGLIGAEKNVSPVLLQSQRFDNRLQLRI